MADVTFSKEILLAKAALTNLSDNPDAVIDVLSAVDFSPSAREAIFIQMGGAARCVLSAEESKVFSKIDKLGNDLRSLFIAEEWLGDLESTRATKALTERLRDFLKEREWGVQLDNGLVGTVGWLTNPRTPLGGLMRLQFRDLETGEKKTARAFTRLPRLQLAKFV